MVGWHCVYVSGILIVCVLSVFQYQMNRVPVEGSGCIAKGQWLDPQCRDCTSPETPAWACPDYCKAMNWYPDTRRSMAEDWFGADMDGIHPDGRRASKLPSQCDRVKKARAGAFNMLVFGEIAYALNCRYLDHTSCTMKQFTENKWAWVAIGITSVLQASERVPSLLHRSCTCWANLFLFRKRVLCTLYQPPGCGVTVYVQNA